MNMHRSITLCAAMAATLCAGSASALVYSVNAGDTAGLLAAIDAANASPEADLIELEKGFYLFEQAYGESSSALPALQGQLRIQGNGAELRRYSKQDFRLLEVAHQAQVQIDNVVFAEGSLGAAINFGKLSCRHCQFIDHTDRRSLAIIENYGELQLRFSDVSFNTVANAARDAGTIVNFGLTGIHASRLQANSLSRRFESLALASALLNFGEARLSDVRITENEAGLEYSGFSTGSVINLGNGTAALSDVVEQGNLPVAQH